LVPSSPSGGELLQFYQRTTHAEAEVILYLNQYTLDVRYYISHQRYGSLSQVGPTDRRDTHSYDPIDLGVKSWIYVFRKYCTLSIMTSLQLISNNIFCHRLFRRWNVYMSVRLSLYVLVSVYSVYGVRVSLTN
jgi:hypothetical protein